ncbi:MAG TPA: transcriptional repressor LexA, partial [Rhodocyclaceae bacterium]|nr:transcriptional repressor LexA [Rhodocyclaceae bacterium]
IQSRYALDAHLFSPRADFLLKVRGLSMIDAGILDGDLLAVHRTREARDGQIVVARVADDVTVKRLKRRNGFVELIAENPDFEPIVVDPGRVDFAIEGIAVGLIRGNLISLS